VSGTLPAKLIEIEVTPATATKHNWTVTSTPTENSTEFAFSLPIKGGGLPEGSSVSVEIYDDKKLIFRSVLQSLVRNGNALFHFTVGNEFLTDSKFSLTKVHKPYPSGEIYWANLKDFAESTKEIRNAEQGDAGQPATAVDSKSEGKEKPKPEPEARSQ
jgi:hypothetical protein